MKDGVVLMYCKDDVLYPVGMTAEQMVVLQMLAKVFEPLHVVFDKPQGQAVNLSNKKG